MTGSSGKYVPPERYVNDSGRTLASREFWKLIRRYAEAGEETGLVHDGPGLADVTIDPDGTWWRPEHMTAGKLARLKDRHRQEHEGRAEWTRHGVTRRELGDGTTELTIEGSRYPTRAERQAGAGPVIRATEPCATRVTPTPRDGTVESSAAYAMVQDQTTGRKLRPPKGLAGYFAADGTVTEDGSARIASASMESVQAVRDIAAMCGIGYGPVRASLREGFPGREKSNLPYVTLTAADLPEWFFIIATHRERVTASQGTREHKDRQWVIDSVTATERREEVFCAVVPESRAFALSEDLMTGNCVLASKSALVRAAQLDPAGARARAAVEELFLRIKIIRICAVFAAAAAYGYLTPQLAWIMRRALISRHQFQQNRSMADIIAAAGAAGGPTDVEDWAA